MKIWADCSHKQRIERWENCLRVLKALTPHERRKHWNMAYFGHKSACGTIACAAGHCGLDPWFRRRGLRLDFVAYNEADWDFYSTWEDGSPVEKFFGSVGSEEIFFDSTRRSVSKVIKEVQVYIKRLKVDIDTMDGRKYDATGFEALAVT